MTDYTLVDAFNETVGLVYEQDQVPFFRAASEDVGTSFADNFKKAPDVDTQQELVTTFAFFIVQQANTVPTKANYSLAIGDTVEMLCKTLNDVVKDRALIPEDFMLCLLQGAKAINDQPGGNHYEEAKHVTVGKIIAAAEMFRPATLVTPEGYQPPTPPEKPAEEQKPAAPALPQGDFMSKLKRVL